MCTLVSYYKLWMYLEDPNRRSKRRSGMLMLMFCKVVEGRYRLRLAALAPLRG
jgi:hypothetical protein